MLGPQYRDILRHLKGLTPEKLDAVLAVMRAAEPSSFHSEDGLGDDTRSERVFYHRPAQSLPMKGCVIDHASVGPNQ